MKGHEFHDGGSLQDWIEHELSHLAAQDQEDLLETSLGDRNLSLRLPLVLHLMIARIAEKLGRSKSAVSEEILTWAVRDVYKQINLPKPTPSELEEFASQIENLGRKKVPAPKKRQS